MQIFGTNWIQISNLLYIKYYKRIDEDSCRKVLEINKLKISRKDIVKEK